MPSSISKIFIYKSLLKLLIIVIAYSPLYKYTIKVITTPFGIFIINTTMRYISGKYHTYYTEPIHTIKTPLDHLISCMNIALLLDEEHTCGYNKC